VTPCPRSEQGICRRQSDQDPALPATGAGNWVPFSDPYQAASPKLNTLPADVVIQ
jgi:hypothetical protein